MAGTQPPSLPSLKNATAEPTKARVSKQATTNELPEARENETGALDLHAPHDGSLSLSNGAGKVDRGSETRSARDSNILQSSGDGASFTPVTVSTTTTTTATMQQQYRPIVPGPTSPSPGKEPPRKNPNPNLNPNPNAAGWKKRVSTACLACKKSKRKCSGIPPCDNCRALNRECIFDETLDQRRRVAAKRTAEELEYHRDMLNDLFRLIRTAEEHRSQRLLEIIRNNAPPEEIRAFIDETLAEIREREQGGRVEGATAAAEKDKQTVGKLEQLRRRTSSSSMAGAPPPFRRKVMDVHFLCDTPPIEVPARPWTAVTDDDQFVSHLVSLYFTWEYPFYAFLDRDVFLRHMKAGEIETELCSPFLVNALLATACHYSEFSESYAIPGDIETKGLSFLREAERLLQDLDDEEYRLSTLQGLLLLHGRYAMSGQDNLSDMMLDRAIRMAEKAGYVSQDNDEPYELGRVEEESDESIALKRTIWGLYQLDTVTYPAVLKPNRIKRVNIAKIQRAPIEEDRSSWLPYPMHKAPRLSYHGTYLHEACRLSEIAADVSQKLYAEGYESLEDKERLSQVVDKLLIRLKAWHEALPKEFDPIHRPPAHVLLLQMRYYSIVITMLICPSGSREQFKPLDLPHSEQKGSADSICIASARAIARLARIHQEEYGISRSHPFALYAINMALFVLIGAWRRDLLPDLMTDPDFIGMIAAFSVVTMRSVRGLHVRAMFRQSQGPMILQSDEDIGRLPEALREVLLDDQPENSEATLPLSSERQSSEKDDNSKAVADGSSLSSPGDDHSTSSGTKEEEQRRPESTGGGDHQSGGEEEEEGSTLCEMLSRYEELNLGQESRAD